MELVVSRIYDQRGDRVEVTQEADGQEHVIMQLPPMAAMDLSDGLARVVRDPSRQVAVDARHWKGIKFGFAVTLGMAIAMVQDPGYGPAGWLLGAVALAGCAGTWRR
jgi:hypothetical protein